MPLLTASLCNQGGRSANQDSVGIFSQGSWRCLVVADGLGGHRGGEIASKLAVETVEKAFRESPVLSAKAVQSYIRAANRAVHEEASRSSELSSMRTTIVVALVGEQHVIIGHVGDSRGYLLRRDQATVRTKDHSVPQALVNAGELEDDQIRFHEDRNRLIKVLGSEPDITPTVWPEAERLGPKDALLLCSDGFWEWLSDLEILVERIKTDVPRVWIAGMAERLALRVQGLPDYDNYSAVAAVWEGA